MRQHRTGPNALAVAFIFAAASATVAAEAAPAPGSDDAEALGLGLRGGARFLTRGEAAPPTPHDFFFVHIPKTGGTTIEILFNRIGIKVGLFKSRDERGNYNPVEVPASFAANYTEDAHSEWCSPWHIPPSHAGVSFENKVSFTIVREPLARLLSQFEWAIKLPELGNSTQIYNEMYETDPTAAFECWVESLVYVGVDSTVDDCHLLPQHMYLTDVNGSAIENVIRFEHLAEDMAAFARKYSLPEGAFLLSQAPRTQEHEKHIDPADIRPATVALVRFLYRADYDAFDYYDFYSPLSAAGA
uniref:Sulfotransferase domain-containing protein n=1 Tax=Phaeomonas parva TaxID=124430 RepID=A0A7S1TV43_9STRA|mmetsp:Transcript_17152/g.52691  ORF Transcript_17152/g.52691 Transcript_17152/m.52691 type:complete len:301 (+) Transcript_17152:47-949(+)